MTGHAEKVRKMASDKIFELLRSSTPFRELTDAELRLLMQQLEPKLSVWLPGETLAHSGAAVDKLYIIESGEVAAQRVTFSGNVYVAHVYCAGELVGINGVYSSPGTWPLSLFALIKSTVLSFSAAPLLSGTKEFPRLQERISHALLQAHVDAENKALIRQISRSTSGTREKLLTFLDLMQDKHQSNVFPLRMSRDELAAFLDVGRSSVFRELKWLTDQGLAVIEKNRTVIINREKFKVFRKY